MKMRLLLGDQLNIEHSWFKKTEDDVCYVQMEMRQETDYAPHHIQKMLSCVFVLDDSGFPLNVACFQDRLKSSIVCDVLFV